ncbi:ArsR/SmtB family transcription factor [Chloroflexota bacterium]
MDYNPMIYQLKAELCKTFSEPKRLIIIDALRDGERSVGDLARIMEIGQAIVSRHLGILRERGVVKTRRDGTSIYYSLSDPKICEACDIVQEILLNQVKKNGELAKKLAV